MVKKISFYWIIPSFLIAGNLMLAQEVQQAAPAPPPARMIPGINTMDPFPRGCVDCHINYVEMEMDTRFSTLLNQWAESVEPGLLERARNSAAGDLVLQGRHPVDDAMLDDIPAGCIACHGRESDIAPPFASMIHNVHLVGGEENHFMTQFQGECTYCHKLDMTTGQWTMPSAPEGN